MPALPGTQGQNLSSNHGKNRTSYMSGTRALRLHFFFDLSADLLVEHLLSLASTVDLFFDILSGLPHTCPPTLGSK
jgi:hypothetical protein